MKESESWNYEARCEGQEFHKACCEEQRMTRGNPNDNIRERCVWQQKVEDTQGTKGKFIQKLPKIIL